MSTRKKIKHVTPDNYDDILAYVDARYADDKKAARVEAVTLALDEFYGISDDTTLCGLALAVRDPKTREAVMRVMFTANRSQDSDIHNLLVKAFHLVPRKQAYGVEVLLWAHEWQSSN